MCVHKCYSADSLRGYMPNFSGITYELYSLLYDMKLLRNMKSVRRFKKARKGGKPSRWRRNQRRSNKLSANFFIRENYIKVLSPKKLLDLKTETISLYSQNIRSIRNKLDAFTELINYNFHIITLSESWMKTEEASILLVPNYAIFSSCRTGRGGGLLLCVKDIYHSQLIYNNTEEQVETIIVKTTIGGKNYFIVTLYFPRTPQIYVLSQWWNRIKDFFNFNDPIIITGDFNTEPDRDRNIWIYINSLFNEFGLISTCELDTENSEISQPTRGQNIIDHVFVNFLCAEPVVYSGFFKSDHQAIIIEWEPKQLHSKQNTNDSNSKYIFALKKLNPNIVIYLLQIYPWEVLESIEPVLAAFFLNKWLHFISMNSCLSKLYKGGNKFGLVPWWNDSLKELKNIKKIALKTYRKNPNTINKNILNEATKTFKVNFQESRKAYLNTYEGLISYTKYCKQQSGMKQNLYEKWIPHLQRHNLSKADSSSEELEEYYKQIPNEYNTFAKLILTNNDINSAINRLKINKIVSIDETPTFIIKTAKPYILQPLVAIFNKLLKEGIFPEEWLNLKIFPVLKKAPSDKYENFRPISRIVNYCKIFEAAVYGYLHNHFDLNKYPQVHYCKVNKSIHTNLEQSYLTVANAWNQGQNVAVIFLDVAAAFDTVLRLNLMNLLERFYNIRDGILSILSILLNRRTYQVIDNEGHSHNLNFLYGIPQGSILSALLFTVIMLPFLTICNYKLFLYADDMKIFISYKESEYAQAQDNLQISLDQLCSYLDFFNLKASPEKTKYMILRKNSNPQDLCINMNGLQIERVFQHKDLGFIWQYNLSLHAFLRDLINKAIKSIWLIKTKLHNVKNEDLWRRAVQVWTLSLLVPFHKMINLKLVWVRKALKSLDRYIYKTIAYHCRLNNNIAYKDEISTGNWTPIIYEIITADIIEISKMFRSSLGDEHFFGIRIPRPSLRSKPQITVKNFKLQTNNRSWPDLAISFYNQNHNIDYTMNITRRMLRRNAEIHAYWLSFMNSLFEGH